MQCMWCDLVYCGVMWCFHCDMTWCDLMCCGVARCDPYVHACAHATHMRNTYACMFACVLRIVEIHSCTYVGRVHTQLCVYAMYVTHVWANCAWCMSMCMSIIHACMCVCMQRANFSMHVCMYFMYVCMCVRYCDACMYVCNIFMHVSNRSMHVMCVCVNVCM